MNDRLEGKTSKLKNFPRPRQVTRADGDFIRETRQRYTVRLPLLGARWLVLGAGGVLAPVSFKMVGFESK